MPDPSVSGEPLAACRAITCRVARADASHPQPHGQTYQEMPLKDTKNDMDRDTERDVENCSGGTVLPPIMTA